MAAACNACQRDGQSTELTLNVMVLAVSRAAREGEVVRDSLPNRPLSALLP